MIVAILVTMLSAASAQTGITVQFYTSSDCSGAVQSEGTGAADACIHASLWTSSNMAFKGKCATASDTVMAHTGTSRAGLEFTYYIGSTAANTCGTTPKGAGGVGSTSAGSSPPKTRNLPPSAAKSNFSASGEFGG